MQKCGHGKIPLVHRGKVEGNGAMQFPLFDVVCPTVDPTIHTHTLFSFFPLFVVPCPSPAV